jgi:hypothetical protein
VGHTHIPSCFGPPALQALTVEEARERQNRLAKMRALLFYHELKAKRLKKIKSKEYRRKLKKAGQWRAWGGVVRADRMGGRISRRYPASWTVTVATCKRTFANFRSRPY